jgi:hypothetical protein
MANYFKLIYGSYTHIAPVAITPRVSYEVDERNRPYLRYVDLTVEGTMFFSGAAAVGDINTAINALRTAYASNDQNFYVYFRDETTKVGELSYSVTSGASASAGAALTILVTEPPHLSQPGAAVYNSYWPYTIGLRVVQELITNTSADAARNVIAFSESVAESGGGTFRNVIMETTAGPAQIFTLTSSPAWHCEHQGSITGWFDYPDVPDPLFSGGTGYMVEAGKPVRHAPQQRYGANYRFYVVDFSYSYQRASAASAVPRNWVSGGSGGP